MIYAKTKIKNRLFVGRIEIISKKEADEHFQSDASLKLEEYRKELGKLGLSLDPGLDVSEVRVLLTRERTRVQHRAFLKKKGVVLGSDVDSSRTRQLFDKHHRASRCYSCTNEVDNELDLECTVCGWIICGDRGACGCGHPKHQSKFFRQWKERSSVANHKCDDPHVSSAPRREQIADVFLDFASARKYALEHHGSIVCRNDDGDGWVVVQRGS